MNKNSPFRYFETSSEIIGLAVLYYVRFPRGLRQAEDIRHERGTDICHESVRYRWNRFGPLFSNIQNRAFRESLIKQLRQYPLVIEMRQSRLVLIRFSGVSSTNSDKTFRNKWGN